jgi:hypothetical protein
VRGLTPAEVSELSFLALPAGTPDKYGDDAALNVMDVLVLHGRVSACEEDRPIGRVRVYSITEQGRRALGLWQSIGGEACPK